MKLYKYISVERAISFLEENGIVLSYPENDFNDVYDCKFKISEDSKKEAFKLLKNIDAFNFYIKSLHNKKFDLPINYKRDLSKNWSDYLENLNETKKVTYEKFMQDFVTLCRQKYPFYKPLETEATFNKTVDNIIEDNRKKAWIGCFSKRNDSILMWAHYANQHKGVCLEYNIDNPNFHDVIYEDTLPTYDLMTTIPVSLAEEMLEKPCLTKEMANELIKPFCVKSKDWSYENEVRCIYNSDRLEDGVYINPFLGRLVLPAGNPTAIYLGCMCEMSEMLELLLAMAENRGISVYKMKKSDEKFLIEKNENFELSNFRMSYTCKEKDLFSEELDKMLNNGNMIGALMTALFVPAHYGTIFGKSEKENYIEWCRHYITEPSNSMPNGFNIPPELLFELKNRFFNYGDANVEYILDGNKVTKIEIDIAKPKPYLNISFLSTTTNQNKECRLNLNVLSLCQRTIDGIALFCKEHKNEFNKIPILNIYDNEKKLFGIKEAAIRFESSLKN